jgi:spermidine synthase
MESQSRLATDPHPSDTLPPVATDTRRTDPDDEHVKPYVHKTLTTKALHFTLSEVQSRMVLKDPDALDLAYTRLMMGFLRFQHDPRHIVMIGLGGGSIAKFCHRHLPRARLQVLEINPHIMALRDEFFVPADGPRFEVIAGDGACFVRDTAERPEVLLVDGFTSEGQPAGLSSQRFYDDCHDCLCEGGLLVVNLHSRHRQFAQQLARVQRSFGVAAVLAVDDREDGNTIVFASKGPALEKARAGPFRRPAALPAAAAQALSGAFEQINRALLQREQEKAV